jgi:transposase
MSRPLSNDLRERVVAAVSGGESCRTVATRCGVAVSSVVKWSQRYRATGSVARGKIGGHRKPVLEPHRAFKERISQTPYLTLHKLKDELAARGVEVRHIAFLAAVMFLVTSGGWALGTVIRSWMPGMGLIRFAGECVLWLIVVALAASPILKGSFRNRLIAAIPR